MRAALDKLDPGSRALLDLSVKRGIADDEIAQVLRAEPGEVAERRESILARIAEDLGSNGPDLVSRVRDALRELPPEGAAPEANGHAAEEEPAEEIDGEVVAEPPAAAAHDDTGPVVDGEVLEELHADDDAPSSEVAEPPVEEPPVEQPPVEEPPVREEQVEDPPAEPPPADPDPIEREPVTESSTASTFPRNAVLTALAAVAAIILVVVIVSGGGDSTDDDGGSQPAQQQPEPRAEATPLEPISGNARATASIEGRTLTLSATGLAGAGHEAWLYDSLSDAVSIGRLEDGRLKAALPADPAKYRYLDVSVEPRDGNPNHSGQSVLRVPIARLTRGD